MYSSLIELCKSKQMILLKKATRKGGTKGK
nr:MAG TPA: hypothetical protein [Caudoviricetes sp.]